MAVATAAPSRECIAELLAAMHALPGTLLVLNRPFSCEEMMTRAEHVKRLLCFRHQQHRHDPACRGARETRDLGQ
jgi:hypothetical protein